MTVLTCSNVVSTLQHRYTLTYTICKIYIHNQNNGHTIYYMIHSPTSATMAFILLCVDSTGSNVSYTLYNDVGYAARTMIDLDYPSSVLENFRLRNRGNICLIADFWHIQKRLTGVWLKTKKKLRSPTCRATCGSRDDFIPQCRYYGVGFHWIHITESKIQFYKH